MNIDARQVVALLDGQQQSVNYHFAKKINSMMTIEKHLARAEFKPAGEIVERTDFIQDGDDIYKVTTRMSYVIQLEKFPVTKC